MGKNKSQGTAHETATVKRFRDRGLAARRIAEGGSKDIGDVFVKGVYEGETPVVAVIWKRLVKGEGERRVADGVREVAILSADDFADLVAAAEANVIIECKATERLNVTRTLDKTIKKARQNG